ncbi:MAG: TonB family protein [Cryobacterium sp.]|nr:TonB family protein [Oligoflexia bacterium]
MSAARFVISTTFRGRTRTETWDTGTPLMLGRTEKGPLWVIENTPNGDVRVRSLGGEIGEISNAHSQVLSEAQIEKGVQVKFKKKDSDEIKLEIRAMRSLHPQFYRETGGVDFAKGFQVYHCVGDWNTESTKHKNRYVGTLRGEEIFLVTTEGTRAKITSSRPGLVVEFNGVVKSLEMGLSFDVSASEFFKASVRYGYASWYFATTSEMRKDKIFSIPDHPLDNRDFYRFAAGALLSLMLIFGGSALLPKQEREEVIPPQILKVLVQKKKAAAPAVKKEIPGEKKEVKEKALAQSEEVAPTPPKPAELIVPKGTSGGKKLEHKQVQRMNKVNNLYQGLMRGGLMKILDSKQILDSSKLGMGGKLKGDSKSVASALSNLALDVNAGAGVGNSKVVGFGGSTNAGVKGPATIGYSDGVKGAITSGTGSDRISLGTAEAEVEEGLTKDEVGRVIHAHMKEVRYCYESSMVRTSRVDGKVILDFGINGKGVVAKAKVSSSTLPDAALGECIMRRLRTWQFPTPKGGVNVDVSYPFNFKTLGG